MKYIMTTKCDNGYVLVRAVEVKESCNNKTNGKPKQKTRTRSLRRCH